MAAAEDAAAVSSDVLLPPPGGKVLKKFLSKLSHGSFLQPCFRAAPASQEAAWELARHCAPRCSRTDQGSRRVGHIVPAEVRSLLAYLSGTGPELPWLQLRNRALLSGVLLVLLSPSTPPGAPCLDTSQCDTLGGEQTASQAVRWFRRRNPTPAANLLLYQPPAALTATGAVAAAAAGSAGGSKRRRDGSTSGALSANAYTASLADLLCNGYPLPPGPLAAMVASRLPESAPLPPSPKQVDHYSCSCSAEADCTALQAALRADAGAGDAIVVPVTQAVPSPGEACLLGVDCEMVQTAAGHELARLSVVGPGEEGVLLDVLVAPQLPVVDHLTQWSGITAEMLAGPGVIPFQEARGKFQALLASRPGAVLVGHSLENDLHALQLVHLRVMDTALLYPHYAGTGSKNSLRWLTKRYLQRDIQSSSEGGGHDSVEDARAALDLALLKVSKGPLFGFPDEKAFYRGNMARPAPPKACSLFTASRTVGGGSTGSPPARVAQWYRPVLVGSPEFVKLHQAGAASSISVLDAADPARVLARAVKESIKLHAQRLASSGAGPLARDAGGEVWAGPGLVVAEGQVQVSGDGGTTEAMALWDAALAAVLPSLPRGSVVVVATQGSVQGPSSHKRQRTEEGDSAQRSAADEGKDDDPTGTHGRVFVLAPTATSSSGEGAAAEE